MRSANSRTSHKRVSYKEASSSEETDLIDDISADDREDVRQPERKRLRTNNVAAQPVHPRRSERNIHAASIPKDSVKSLERYSRKDATLASRFTRSTTQKMTNEEDHKLRTSGSRRKSAVSYREASSSSDDSHGYQLDDDTNKGTNTIASSNDVERRTEASEPVSKYRSRTKSNSIAANPLLASSNARIVESDGIIPPWATLPYEVLLQIFAFGSYSLYDSGFDGVLRAQWLLGVARCCRAFAEPALTALYRCPPLLGTDKLRRLLELLERLSDSLYINYSVKVKHLELDVFKAVAHAISGPFDLAALILRLPRLENVQIFHSLDKPQFRRLGSAVRWSYPNDLFTALLSSDLRLKSWQWNASMHLKRPQPDWIRTLHQAPPFQTLRDITIVNYNYLGGSQINTYGVASHGPSLVETLSLLPQLESLNIESCAFVNDEIMSSLPQGLTHLKITNCNDLTSQGVQAFLSSHGTRLQTLVFDHNRSLNISFLAHLKNACPQLQSLKMDMNYYNTYASHRNSDPSYICLLTENDIPTWPAALQSLELIHMRKWSVEAAKMFFSSLVNSAPELPDLRRLVLKAILNIAWRDRAGFRDHWIGRLQKMFLRKVSPPSPHLVSLRAFRNWKASAGGLRILAVTEGNGFINVLTDSPSPGKDRSRNKVPRTRSWKARTVEAVNPDSDFESPDSDVPIATTRKYVLRHRDDSGNAAHASAEKLTASHQQKLKPPRKRAADNSSSDESKSTSENEQDVEWQNLYIQGMCKVVEVRIDNLRPTESQFNENDFLDSSGSDDGEWQSGNEGADDDQYAW